ncbi:uncharacterized protein LOC116849868 isoform X2 [Odontomachus brunneus]|uniref:uncharacterized protein LOC116849868 isoform X2 n=1 Tax=Odontomachus brunneus TaxID=486640 RepID=UPI0013F1FF98|nr:uncharacterized protein LOC116849868 isoform X2 [Odontomachus brunneus]
MCRKVDEKAVASGQPRERERERELSPTRMDETVKNSTKEAMQTIAKDYSMVLDKNRSTSSCSKEHEEKNHAFRSRAEKGEEKYLKNPFENRRATGTRYFSRRRSRAAYSDPYVETNECAIPLSVKSKNKKHWNPANNINADNRRMTGNVNIYICSETNESGQAKGKPRLNAPSCMDASSDASTELRSSSRYVSGSSASLRKPINDVREKRQKVLPSNSIRNKGERNSIVRDNETWRKTRTTQTSDSNEDGRQVDVKLSDQEESKNAISSVRPSKDQSLPISANLYQHSSNSVGLPRDNSQGASSWIAIYPSEARCRCVNTDLYLSSTINVPSGRKDRRENDDVCGITDSGCTMYDAIDSSGSLLKSAGTDCATCFTDDSECRDVKMFRDSILNRRDIREKRMGVCKAHSIECNQQRAARQRSTCSCIAEEEEDCCTSVVKERPVNLRPTRVICSEPARDATVRVISLNNAGDSLSPISKSIFRVSKCTKATAAAYGATLENSQESSKVTRVSKKLAAEELPFLGIAVCKTIYAEPKGPPEEGMVRETVALRKKSDLEAPDEALEETICKIPHLNFADRDVVERLSVNDAKDKLAKEKRNGTDLNDRRENVVDCERVTVQFADSSRNNVAPNLDKQQSAEYRRKNVSYKKSNDSPVSIRAIRGFKPLSEGQDPIKFSVDDRSNYSKNSEDAKGTLKNSVDREKRVRMRLSPLLRPMRSHLESVSKYPAERDFTSTDGKQPKEKMAETSKEENDKKDRPDKIGLLTRNPKDTPLYRSLKKLLDLIQHRKAIRRMKDETEKNRNDLMKKTQHDAKEDDSKPRSIPERLAEINDYEKDRRNIGEAAYRPMRPSLANKHEIVGDIAFESQRPTATDATELSKGEAEERDISDLSQTAPSKPKLLRIISAKRSRLRPTKTTAEPKSPEIETRVVSEEIARTNESTDRDEIPLETAPAKITEDTIVAESTDISVQDAAKDTVAETPKDIAVDENRVSEGIVDVTTDGLREKVEEAPREPVSCECGTHFEPNSGLRSVTERTECKDLLEDCFRKYKQSEAKERECIRAPPTQYPKSRSKIDKLILCTVSPLSPRVCTNYRGTRKECRQAVIPFHCCRHGQECGCDMCECKCRRRDKRYRGTESSRNRHKPMICLYCDNPRDECTCKAPIGKCSRCGLPSDVCDCQDDQGHDRARVVGCANKGGSIRVTSWKPKREVRRYFARNDFGPGAIKDCRCHEKPKQQWPEELPYQRLNVFSDVMNELQRKMSESVCCRRCTRDTCCGGDSQVNSGR